MKVYTVEWHGDYDGGEVEAVFDSIEKAQALLSKIQELGAKAKRMSGRNCDRLHRVKPPNCNEIRSTVPRDERPEAINKWDRAWSKWICRDYLPGHEYQYSYSDYSVREYEVQ